MIPVYLRPGSSQEAIHIVMRSPFDMLRHAASKVQVPAPHLEAGIAEPETWRDWGEDPFMTIRSSRQRPRNAQVAVRYRDWWFYIDATDTVSKRSFRILKLLIGMRLADRDDDQRMPVLTVPVG